MVILFSHSYFLFLIFSPFYHATTSLRFPSRTLTASSSIDVAHDWSRYVLAAYRGLEQAKDLIGTRVARINHPTPPLQLTAARPFSHLCQGADGREGEGKQSPHTINVLTHGTVPIVLRPPS
jgi:hypothetical protein